jgi:GNAT superfamily N-acetyltransferase
VADPEIRRQRPGDVDAVVAAGHLFDRPPIPAATVRFLTSAGHHLLIAYVGDAPAGFITGIETLHPDKGAEMMLYELGVDAPYRRTGIGTALVHALCTLARDVGCYGMWVPIEPDNEAAIATYRAAGASPAEAAVTMSWTF